MAPKKRKPFFERLKEGLSEGIAHARGELTLRTVEILEKTGARKTGAKPDHATPP